MICKHCGYLIIEDEEYGWVDDKEEDNWFCTNDHGHEPSKRRRKKNDKDFRRFL